MIVYLGIDPGVTGACCELHCHADGRQEIVVHPTPVVWRATAKGKKRRYDLPAVSSLVAGMGHDIALAYVEQQSARPGQGVTSTFATGYGAGMWDAMLTAFGIPHVVVRPQKWRAVAGLRVWPKGTKTAAIKADVRTVAARRFPGVAIHLDHADAVMLAVAAASDNGVDRRGTG